MFGKGKTNFAEVLNVIGAGLRDFGGDSNHLGAARQQIEAARAKQQRQQALTQATQGLTPQQQALARLDPSGFAGRQINNQFQDPLQVAKDKRAADAQAFQQNRLTQNDANAQTQQGLNNQFRQEGRQIQQGQFGQQQQLAQDKFGFQQAQAATQNEQFERQFGFKQGQAGIQNDFAQQGLDLRAQGQAATQAQAAAKLQASQIPSAKEQRDAIKFQQDQEDRAKAGETSELQRKGVLDQITRLRSGDLKGGFGSVFGKSRANPFTLTPGSERNNAKASLNQIVSNLTLDKIANFKGAISDKDLEIAQGAATRLQNRNISDSEAEKALNELFTAFGGVDAAGGVGPSDGLSAEESAELEELERQFGGL